MRIVKENRKNKSLDICRDYLTTSTFVSTKFSAAVKYARKSTKVLMVVKVGDNFYVVRPPVAAKLQSIGYKIVY